MISVEEALEQVLASVVPLEAENAPLEAALDRVLARDLMAREGLPPFDNSAMDGFAVRSADLAAAGPDRPASLAVVGTARAGAGYRKRLGPGETVRIMTGAPVPAGADAVVMKELVSEADGAVRFTTTPAAGDHIRPRWEDVRVGEPLLPKGRLIRPYEIALLAAQGFASVPVIRRPRAAVLATGDELADFREPALAEGRIRDSNSPALSAALLRWGAQVERLSSAPDDPARLREALEPARESDLLLVSGGVSVGDFDFTRTLLEAIGLRTVFWKVAQKPGKPLLFGLLPRRGGGETAVFGLPGNPVSALVCLEIFVRPAVEAMQGRALGYPSWHLEGEVQSPYRLHDQRRHFLFCEARAFAGGFVLRILKPQGSAMVGMACRANALAMAPAGARELKAGDRVPFRWLK